MEVLARFSSILVLFFWLCSCQADISLKFRNAHYIQPSTQQRPVKEDCYNKNTFEKIRFEHINTPNKFSLDVPNLDISDSHKSNVKVGGFLPPTSQGSSSNTALKISVSDQTEQVLSSKSQSKTVPQNYFEGPNYLPPQQQNNVHHQGKDFRSTASFIGPEILQPSKLHDINHNALLKANHYLPPQQQAGNVQFELNKSLKGIDNLPPYQSQDIAEFQGPNYLPPQVHQPQIQSLPNGYDFQKPANAEQAIEELHKLPADAFKSQIGLSNSHKKQETGLKNGISPTENDVQQPENSPDAKSSFNQFSNLQQTQFRIKSEDNSILKSSVQPFKGSHYLPPAAAPSTFKGPEYLPPTAELVTFKGHEYLPPNTIHQTFVNPKHSYNFEVSKGTMHLPTPIATENYLPPVSATHTSASLPHQKNSIVFDQLLPPTEPTSYQPLSGYMKSVKPSDRYGRPLPEYSTLTAKAISDNRSSLHHTDSSTQRHYAPNMSYTNNGGAKIRTVKIFNSDAEKTVKVLESLDHTGIKTLKIFGSPNEHPTADYRIVKVVSNSKEQTVQIFNDHQDVVPNENATAKDGFSQNYLPPRGKRNAVIKTNTLKNRLSI